MTDFMEQARAELLAEDAVAFDRRVRDRAQKLENAARQAADAALPVEIDEVRTRLAALRSRHDGLTARKDRSRRNPALTISAAEDAEIERLKGQIQTLETNLRVFGRLEGKAA